MNHDRFATAHGRGLPGIVTREQSRSILSVGCADKDRTGASRSSIRVPGDPQQLRAGSHVRSRVE